VFPDWIGAVLNGTGTIDWWIKELEIWSEKVAVSSCRGITGVISLST
jgi:hypothetical protein